MAAHDVTRRTIVSAGNGLTFQLIALLKSRGWSVKVRPAGEVISPDSIVFYHGAAALLKEIDKLSQSPLLVIVCQSSSPASVQAVKQLRAARTDLRLFGLFTSRGLETAEKEQKTFLDVVDWLSSRGSDPSADVPRWLRDPMIADDLMSLALVAAMPDGVDRRAAWHHLRSEECRQVWDRAVAQASALGHPEGMPGSPTLVAQVSAFRDDLNAGEQFLNALVCYLS